jgi:hypothetical protein
MMGNLVFKWTTCFAMLFVCSRTSLAQMDKKDSLVASFNAYQSRNLQEKLFVHLDKSFYLVGEIIWFKVYDVDASSNRPLPLSRITYAEILDKDQRPVLQAKIGMASGKGDGSFRIPVSIPSGHYTFRAYTSWMRNFSPDFYFQQQLTILNTLNDTATVDSSRRNDNTIRFFPEGGNLVNGLTSVVAFRAADPSGNGRSCQGVVVDQKKDTVARFQTNRFGMGKFSFTPLKGNTYSARVQTGSSSFVEQLPPAYDQGYVMHLNTEDAHHLTVSVRAVSPPADPVLYLFVQTRNKVKTVQVNFLKNDETR